MAERNILHEKIDIPNITDCSICKDVFSNPKLLPCMHTYCLKCLETSGQDKLAGSQMSCPLCRKEFEVPPGGFPNLPNNLFLGKLLEVKKISTQSADETQCDGCDEETAKMYCVHCRQNLCNQCTKCHKRFAGTKEHQLLALGKELSLEELARSCVSYCQQHRSDPLTHHCFDCKTAICMKCYISKHSTHKLSDIDEVADEYRSKIQANIVQIEESITQNEKLAAELRSEKDKFENQMAQTEASISERGEDLKKLIETHTNDMLQKVHDMKKTRVKEFETAIDDVERHIVIMEGFKRYSVELKDKGTSSDTACYADNLHERATELEQLNVIGELRENSFKVAFTASSFERDYFIDKQNIIGRIEKQFREISFENLKTINSTGQVVRGLTTLDDKLYVVRNQTRTIQEYEITSYSVKRDITPTSTTGHVLNVVVDLTSCNKNNCLYIADAGYQAVHKVELTGVMTTWLVGKPPESLSVSPFKDTILITFLNAPSSVHEYTPAGVKVREIALDPITPLPRHLVQFTDVQFLVSHGNPNSGANRVCMFFELNGETTSQFVHGTTFGGGDGQVNAPTHLAVGRGYILVADSYNNRVLVMSSSLKLLGTVTVPELTLSLPYRLHLDLKREQLYIGEQNSGRIVILDVKRKDDDYQNTFYT